MLLSHAADLVSGRCLCCLQTAANGAAQRTLIDTQRLSTVAEMGLRISTISAHITVQACCEHDLDVI
jgi:hypothetical protein